MVKIALLTILPSNDEIFCMFAKHKQKLTRNFTVIREKTQRDMIRQACCCKLPSNKVKIDKNAATEQLLAALYYNFNSIISTMLINSILASHET